MRQLPSDSRRNDAGPMRVPLAAECHSDGPLLLARHVASLSCLDDAGVSGRRRLCSRGRDAQGTLPGRDCLCPHERVSRERPVTDWLGRRREQVSPAHTPNQLPSEASWAEPADAAPPRRGVVKWGGGFANPLSDQGNDFTAEVRPRAPPARCPALAQPCCPARGPAHRRGLCRWSTRAGRR